MITSFDILVPTVMGNGAALSTGIRVRDLGCNKVLVIYDRGIKEAGIAGPIVDNINNAGVETVCFDDVQPDPPDTIVEKAADIARKEGIDGIVAVGGGSAMDTAKGINVLINNEPPITNYFGVQKNLKPGVPLVFIPTTSGTGSETTNMCVITSTADEKKDSVISSVCVGTLAILDPELTRGLPAKMTAATGVDALAHAVESLTGGHANPRSDALAREAIRMIKKWLPVAYEDGSNLEARENMIYASSFAGMAFTNALVHVGHSIAHTLGAHFHIPHGIACGVILPEVAEYTARTEYKKVRMICDCLGEEIPANANPEEIGVTARKALRSFIKSVGIPNIKELEIPLEKATGLAPLVTADSGLALAPYRITAKKIAEMIKSAYDA